MAKHHLKAQPRTLAGRQVKKLRRQGLVPANVFGREIKSTQVQVAEKALGTLLGQAGESALIYLEVEGEKEDRPVMISELRRNPVTGQVQHASLHQVNLQEKTTVAVPVKLTGVAPAEAEKQGILVQQLHEVEIEALPADVPESVEVDISGLAAVDDAVYAKDIQLGGKLTLKSDPGAIIVQIEPLAAEEPVEAPPPVEGEEAAPVEGEEAAKEEQPAAGEVKEEEKTGESEQSS